MSKKDKLKNKELRSAGLDNEDLISKAREIYHQKFAPHGKSRVAKREFLEAIQSLTTEPEKFAGSPFSELAEMLLNSKFPQSLSGVKNMDVPARPLSEPIAYVTFGKGGIDGATFRQMNDAMSLPVTIAGALMPDAHVGYGLPIGGVLATRKDIVIPYAVGMDIACRMCMSIFEPGAEWLEKNHEHLRNILISNTEFGNGPGNNQKDHSVLEDPAWESSAFIKQLQHKAARQLGTSGGGNHFAEWGIIEMEEGLSSARKSKQKYLALLTHSGSRGLGASVAQHFSKLAQKLTPLSAPFNKLAWLNLNSEEGAMYWEYMNLAGSYASACHHVIHEKIAADLGMKPVKIVENHHNFAWKEELPDGKEVIVHRKGATPAAGSEEGIIPGSMSQPGFYVRGKGNHQALNSAAHGAGRTLSRRKAKQVLDQHEVDLELKKEGISLTGGGLDEAPMVYKNIHDVMNAQSELVEILGAFYPKIVRMA